MSGELVLVQPNLSQHKCISGETILVKPSSASLILLERVVNFPLLVQIFQWTTGTIQMMNNTQAAAFGSEDIQGLPLPGLILNVRVCVCVREPMLHYKFNIHSKRGTTNHLPN